MSKEQPLEKRLEDVEQMCHEVLKRCDLLGRQITQIKDAYAQILIEVNIIKQGGNI